MIAMIKVRAYEESDTQYRDFWTIKDDCESFEEAGAYIDRLFGKDAELIKIEFVDGCLYLNEEVFKNLRNDKYFNDSLASIKEIRDEF